MPPAGADEPLRFDHFDLHPAERVLRVNGTPVSVGSRAFDVLLALTERHGRLVTKQELLDLVWPGLVVEEHNIATQIGTLRKLLGANAIATVPGRGYRLTAVPAPASAAAPATSAALPPSHNLPEQRTRFVGREAALADLARLLPQARLLTLTGIGGCGKTRLALKFAQQQLVEFAGGVWFVDLSSLKDVERVVSTCAAVLGVREEGDVPLIERLRVHLAARRTLLLLDNCEHVIDGVVRLVDALMAGAGGTTILATSREALGVSGEQVYPVRSLSLPTSDHLPAVLAAESVRVFVDRARLALPDFEVDGGNAAPLAEICRRLDGIALAVELAAARVTMLSVAEIAARLDDRFRLLTGGSRALPRHQTLAAAMSWSYEQMAPAEQRMLRQVSVFAGGWTLEAAADVAQTTDEYEALTLLTALHDKSLLVVDRGTGDGGGGPRYRMLETVRQYALERLNECGESEAARGRHAGFFLALAETAAPQLRGPQQSQWMARLREEQENLVAALSWCGEVQSPVDPQWGLRLAAATNRYWLFNAIELGCSLTLAALLRDPAGADGPARFETLLGLAGMYMHRGQREAGLPHAQAALSIAQRLGAVESQARALAGIGNCLSHDDEEAARRHYEQARDLARSGGHGVPLASALNNIAVIDFRQGKLESAVQGLRQSLHLSRGQGDVRMALIVLHNLVRVLVAARSLEDAHACAVEAELLLRGVGEDVLKLELIEVAAGIASSRGEHDIAARLWGFSVQRYLDAGYRRPREDEAQLARLSVESRRALGDAAFDEAEAAGRKLDLDAAMLELRQWLERAA